MQELRPNTDLLWITETFDMETLSQIVEEEILPNTEFYKLIEREQGLTVFLLKVRKTEDGMMITYTYDLDVFDKINKHL